MREPKLVSDELDAVSIDQGDAWGTPTFVAGAKPGGCQIRRGRRGEIGKEETDEGEEEH